MNKGPLQRTPHCGRHCREWEWTDGSYTHYHYHGSKRKFRKRRWGRSYQRDKQLGIAAEDMTRSTRKAALLREVVSE